MLREEYRLFFYFIIPLSVISRVTSDRENQGISKSVLKLGKINLLEKIGNKADLFIFFFICLSGKNGNFFILNLSYFHQILNKKSLAPTALAKCRNENQNFGLDKKCYTGKVLELSWSFVIKDFNHVTYTRFNLVITLFIFFRCVSTRTTLEA